MACLRGLFLIKQTPPCILCNIKLFNPRRNYIYFKKVLFYSSSTVKHNTTVSQSYKNFLEMSDNNNLESDVLSVESIDLKNQTEKDINDFLCTLKQEGANPQNVRSICYKLLHLNKISQKMCYSTEKNLLKNQIFIDFCKLLEKNLHMFHANDLFPIFKLLLEFKISFHSLFGEKLLNLMLDKVNILEKKVLLELYIDLHNNSVPVNELTSALKTACLIILEDDLSLSNLDLKKNAYFFSKECIPKNIRLQMAYNLLNFPSNLWTQEVYVCVAKGLLFLKNINAKTELYKKISKDLLSKPDFKWQKKEHFNFSRYILFSNLDKPFIEYLCRTQAANNYSFDEIVLIMWNFCQKGYFIYTPLYEKIIEFCNKYKNESKNINANCVCYLAAIFSQTDFANVTEDTKNYILNQFLLFNTDNFVDDSGKSASFLTAFNLNLEYLNIHKRKNWEQNIKCINKFYAERNNLSKKGMNYHQWRYFIFCQCITILYPEYRELLSDEFYEEFSDGSKIFNTFKWKDVLYDVFGGEEYVLHDCHLLNQHYFNYVAVLNPDNSPMNLSLYKLSYNPIDLSKLNVPEGCKKLGFVEINKYYYSFKNAPIKFSKVRLFLKLIERLGYKGIILSDGVSLDELDIKLYVIREIESKCGDLKISYNFNPS